MQKGEVASANAHLERPVQIMPDNARALVGLALTETVLGARDAGLAHAARAHALAPHNSNILSTLGAIHLYREEPARAVAVLEESLGLNPNQVNAVLNLALALSKSGRQAEAEARLAAGLALSDVMTPGNAHAQRVAAEVYGSRDPARAQAAWERYIAWLRSVPDPSPRMLADLAYSEGRLQSI